MVPLKVLGLKLRVFYKQGYKVGIYDINESLAQELANDLGPNARAGYLDVSDYSQWQHILKEFTEWAGELNILVNNAVFLYSGAFETTDIKSSSKNNKY